MLRILYCLFWRFNAFYLGLTAATRGGTSQSASFLSSLFLGKALCCFSTPSKSAADANPGANRNGHFSLAANTAWPPTSLSPLWSRDELFTKLTAVVSRSDVHPDADWEASGHVKDWGWQGLSTRKSSACRIEVDTAFACSLLSFALTSAVEKSSAVPTVFGFGESKMLSEPRRLESLWLLLLVASVVSALAKDIWLSDSVQNWVRQASILLCAPLPWTEIGVSSWIHSEASAPFGVHATVWTFVLKSDPCQESSSSVRRSLFRSDATPAKADGAWRLGNKDRFLDCNSAGCIQIFHIAFIAEEA